MSKNQKRRNLRSGGPFRAQGWTWILNAKGEDVCKIRYMLPDADEDMADTKHLVDALNNAHTMTQALDLIVACASHVRTAEDGERIKEIAKEALRTTGYLPRAEAVH